MWKDYGQVEDELHAIYGNDQLEKIHSLYCLHDLIYDSMPIKNFKPRDGWSKAIKLTDYAASVIDNVKESASEYSDNEYAVASLAVFYHHEFFIDIGESDLELAANLLQDEIRSRNLRLPDRFGRQLYDRYNDRARLDRPEFITPDEVDTLLAETDQGVYQIGDFLTGPFGLLRSKDHRYLPPNRKIGLWHCSDSGCGKLHFVKFQRYSTGIVRLISQLKKGALNLGGPESEWRGPISRMGSDQRYPRGREYHDLPVLIADAIPGEDRTALVAEALSGQTGRSLRDIISNFDRSMGQGTSQAVASKLSPTQQTQLLCVLSDPELVSLIDRAVWKKAIKIPPTEVRSSQTSPPTLSFLDGKSSLCMFGIRSNRRVPPIFMSSMIYQAYRDTGNLENLAWLCRKSAGNGAAGAGDPIEYMTSHDPRVVIKDLVLPIREVAKAVAGQLHIDLDAEQTSEQTTDRLLWKFGFDTPRYESKYVRFQAQLELFKEELLKHRQALTEEDRDSIRSRGVNVFVSLEHIIEEVISYNVWVLNSDHFFDTDFTYSLSEAIREVANALGEKITAGDYEAIWDPKGGNVFGVLLVYARAAANWMKGLVTQDRSDLGRPDQEMPHYADKMSQEFRFRHKPFWADSDKTQIRHFSDEFDRLISDLEKAKIPEIRNGLDHHREEDRFPQVDTIVSCEARLSQFLKTADVNRFLPKYYWMFDRKSDLFGLIEHYMADYAGRKLILRGPSPISGLNYPTFQTAHLIPFGNLMGLPNSDVVFTVNESSIYSSYWSNYPRRPNLDTILTAENIAPDPQSGDDLSVPIEIFSE